MFTTDYRHQARHLALQALYELDCTDHPVGDVLRERLAPELHSDDTRHLARCLVLGVLEHQSTLDTLIHRYAPEWPLAQIAIIDRNILRLAIFELAASEDAPVRVAISEAVVLAKTFGAESAPRFVNGVLGTLASHETDLQTAFDKPLISHE